MAWPIPIHISIYVHRCLYIYIHIFNKPKTKIEKVRLTTILAGCHLSSHLSIVLLYQVEWGWKMMGICK